MKRYDATATVQLTINMRGVRDPDYVRERIGKLLDDLDWKLKPTDMAIEYGEPEIELFEEE